MEDYRIRDVVAFFFLALIFWAIVGVISATMIEMAPQTVVDSHHRLGS
jgi:hypothetical protein